MFESLKTRLAQLRERARIEAMDLLHTLLGSWATSVEDAIIADARAIAASERNMRAELEKLATKLHRAVESFASKGSLATHEELRALSERLGLLEKRLPVDAPTTQTCTFYVGENPPSFGCDYPAVVRHKRDHGIRACSHHVPSLSGPTTDFERII